MVKAEVVDWKARYQNALKIVETYIYPNTVGSEERHDLEEAFPELAENRDEKIEKAIKLILIATEEDQDVFYRTHNLTRKECTDWLDQKFAFPKWKVAPYKLLEKWASRLCSKNGFVSPDEIIILNRNDRRWYYMPLKDWYRFIDTSHEK